MKNSIELISPNILDMYPELSNELIRMSSSLGLSSGWHYPLDWTWLVSHINQYTGIAIVDAGAGIGLLQWYLASKGAHVISIDRSERTCIPFHLLEKFHVSAYRPGDEPLRPMELLNITNGRAHLSNRAKALVRGLVGQWRSRERSTQVMGSVQIYHQDLRYLNEIPDGSIDLVVSVSALEHNDNIQVVKDIIEELERKLAPGGTMLVTLPASEKEDWFFEPAYSWCFSEKTLRYLFGLSEGTPSNFRDYAVIFELLAGSTELKKNISWRYFLRPNSGMPWGRWNPKYLPVGIMKTKQV